MVVFRDSPRLLGEEAGMAYSKDLRERVVAAVDKDGLSRGAAASRFTTRSFIAVRTSLIKPAIRMRA